ncbi:MAG: PIN domain-containing protein [Burkholderiales bacterium]
MKTFFDTNVLVYAVDPSAGLKHAQADALMARHMQERTLVLSTQVLQEGYSVLTRKKQVPADTALDVVSTWAEEAVVPASVDLVLAGLALSRRYQMSMWDGLIVQAALQAGCGVLLSEDLQAGMRFGDLEVVNPFVLGAHEALPAPRARARRGPRSAARQG